MRFALISSPSHCPDSKRTFTKRVLLEKHIQLIHGLKEAERRSALESGSMEEATLKDQVMSPEWTKGVERLLIAGMC